MKKLLSPLLSLVLLASCTPVRLYDAESVDPSDVAILMLEASPNTTVEDIFVNNNPLSAARPIKVLFGDQQIEFKYAYEDKDNPTLTPSFRGVCRGSFYAQAGQTYSITTAGIWRNQAKESRFWVVQPEREQAGAIECTKGNPHAPRNVVEKDIAETTLSSD